MAINPIVVNAIIDEYPDLQGHEWELEDTFFRNAQELWNMDSREGCRRLGELTRNSIKEMKAAVTPTAKATKYDPYAPERAVMRGGPTETPFDQKAPADEDWSTGRAVNAMRERKREAYRGYYGKGANHG